MLQLYFRASATNESNGVVIAFEIYQAYICNLAVNRMFVCDHTGIYVTGGGGDVGASVTELIQS